MAIFDDTPICGTLRARPLLITAGLLNKQAGAELGVKEKTIKVHREPALDQVDGHRVAHPGPGGIRADVPPRSTNSEG
jgi:hypothetical protein